MRRPASLAFAVVATIAHVHAQYTILNDLSFGTGSRISENAHAIPHYSMQGTPRLPDLLSNKLILTPPAPGNQRGAVWADAALDRDEWAADVSFRVSGPERGGGNINIWLVKEGGRDVGTSSIYTAGYFEGLALVLDTHGGSGGMIRAFLNDGQTDYRSSHVNTLAFAHCNYAYRNLGRPSDIKMTQTATNFRVDVDGTLCFESGKVQMPRGYKFGVTAASADVPDSVEVFKLVVMAPDAKKAADSGSGGAGHQHKDAAAAAAAPPKEDSSKKPMTPSKFSRADSGKPDHGTSYDDDNEAWTHDDVAEDAATKYTSSQAQFEDLHNRLQSINRHLSVIFRAVGTQHSVDEKRHEETSSMIHNVKVAVQDLSSALRKVDAMDARLQSLEQELRSLRSDLSHKVQTSETNIRSIVDNTHAKIAKKVEEHAAPGHTRLIAIIVGSQVVVVAAYALYKRRKGSVPKKYL